MLSAPRSELAAAEAILIIITFMRSQNQDSVGVFLAALFVFLFGSPSYSEAAETRALKAGAAMSDITPHMGTLLDGAITSNGPALHVHDNLHARGLVVDDGATRIAIVVCDSTMIDRTVMDRAKEIIKERCGLPNNRVLVSATHTHATPRTLPGLTDSPLNAEYERFLSRRIADTVEQAIANLAPAQVGWTRFQKPEYVHNRRWFLKAGSDMGNPFGEVGDQVKMNASGDGLINAAGPVDPEVFALSIQTDSGRPIALLANYGTHYVGGYRRGHVSADYFGLFSEKVETLIGEAWMKRNPDAPDFPPFVAMMTNGTSGDVRATDLSVPKKAYQPWELMEEVAESLARDVEELYPSIEYAKNLRVNMVERELKLGVRKPSPERVQWAREVFAKYENNPELPRPKHTLNPLVYAREALALNEFPDRKGVIVQAICLGDLAIVSSPCETFAETGLAIKRESPFESTFTIELANGADGYLPTREHHKYGGYETWEARSSFLEVNAESEIRGTQLELLRELHESK